MSAQPWFLGHLYELGRYAGICQGEGWQPHHVFLAEESTAGKRLSLAEAQAWVKTLPDADLASLPTRNELALLYANLRYNFNLWVGEHWSNEVVPMPSATHSEYFWGQDFRDGKQSGYHKDALLLARAVRRLRQEA